MKGNIEEFKEFVRTRPGLREAVRNGEAKWQSLYEEWYLYGSDDGQWDRYKTSTSSERVSNSNNSNNNDSTSSTSSANEQMSASEMAAQAFSYIQKMDIDKVQKTMGTVQQFIQIFQTMQAGKGGGGAAGNITHRGQNDFSGVFSKFHD